MKNTVRLHNMILHTKVLGPGIRTAIWFQGCNRTCKNCMSPDTKNLNGGIQVSVDKVVDEIIKLDDIEGITISGGEPFLQVNSLYELLSSIKDSTDLGIIIYTGFTIKQLQEMKDSKVELILTELADLIIYGEYVDELNDGRSLIGSSNQGLHFMTDRYIDYEQQYSSKARNVEVLAFENELFLIGIPNKNTLSNWNETVVKFNDNKQMKYK